MVFENCPLSELSQSYDKSLSEAVKFIDQIPRLYALAYDEVGRLERVIRDLEHMLELDELGDDALLACAKEIADARKLRRVAKNAVTRLKPMCDFIGNQRYKDAINALPQLLGAVRSIERTQSVCVYTPKELDETTIKRLRGGKAADETEPLVAERFCENTVPIVEISDECDSHESGIAAATETADIDPETITDEPPNKRAKTKTKRTKQPPDPDKVKALQEKAREIREDKAKKSNLLAYGVDPDAGLKRGNVKAAIRRKG